ncbi:SSH1 [Candida pseudojiufengensis]|uniref:SSH1 n=1 Tax=Candida pseudojiufengensis TaxID=497109 RepID=UPI0022250A5F|nr:SSH1 [Candida pseudojiufengensis]KAI5960404.1 SSH1 [Candida pseudojiufengensis]
MSGFRLLDLIKFFLPILPEIELPYESIKFDERIVYTIGSAIIFLFGQLPIYGLIPNAQFHLIDPFFQFRSIFAMEKATLLELGLLPIITSGFLWQILAGLKIININLSLRYDRELFQSGQKLTSWFLAIIFAVGLIYSGYYDNVIRNYSTYKNDSIPIGSYFIIFLQIISWQIIVSLLVELFDKGYGFGSGILCFLTLQHTTNFIGELVGIEVYPILNSNKFENFGSLMNLIRNFSIFNLKSTIYQIWHSFTRTQLPNLTQFYIALGSILIIIALQNFRVDIPIRSTKVRGMSQMFPIRLLYCGGLPLIFSYSVLANLQIIGYIIWSILIKLKAPPILITLLANYNIKANSNRAILTGGFLYYFSPESNLLNSILSPIRTIIYSLTIIILSIWFAQKWSYISGSSPKDISKQFKDQGISIAGKRDISITKELSKIIPTAAITGAFVISLLAVVGDFLGGLGRNSSIIISLLSAFGILEEFMIEYQQAGGSQFSNALSGFT